MAGTIAHMTQEDRHAMRSYYDEFGDSEWDRLQDTISGRVSLEVHRCFLTRFINAGDRVLEIS